MRVHSTIAYEAQENIKKIMSYENRIYEPWQLSEHSATTVRLSTTFDELKLLWNEPLYLRPGFHVNDESATLPHFVSKLSFYENDFIDAFKKKSEEEPDKATMYESLDDLNAERVESVSRQTLNAILNEDGKIDKEIFLYSDLNRFKYMRQAYQEQIVISMNRILSEKCDLYKNEMVLDSFKIINTVLSIDDHLFEMYHHFDYQYENPKILIIDEKKESLNENGTIRLSFLMLLGFDIFIFAPQGYSSLENVFKKDCYDLHLGSINQPKTENENFQEEEMTPKWTKKRMLVHCLGLISVAVFILLYMN